MSGLGRLLPPNDAHLARYPLTVATAPAKPAPMVIGVNWYAEFDRPTRDSAGYWWVARDERLTRVRGGHCVCLKPRYATDLAAWQLFYDQQDEGICVGEGVSRLATQNNRKRYQPRWLYDRCKERDGIPDEEGTYVRTGLEVLRDLGHVPARPGEAENLTPGGITRAPSAEAGISAFRWARSVDDALAVLGYAGLDFVDVLNSWGTSYPHVVRMPATVLDRLRREDGEIGVATDR